ncbi:MAG: hypothetical protein KJ880_04720, partial [Candidatus Omnitrophica bacterium]|nr:hypothetical protein [Candidatus Omnitrophota bacterium]
QWINKCLEDNLSGPLASRKELISQLIVGAFNLYEQEAQERKYPHNRFGRADIDAFLVLLNEQPNLADDAVRLLAYYTLGIGLRDDRVSGDAFRREFIKELNIPIDLESDLPPEQVLEYALREDGFYDLVVKCNLPYHSQPVELLREKTRLTIQPGKEVAATTAMTQQLVSMIIAYKARHIRRVMIDEGNPGGGKTRSFEEFSRSLGLDFYPQQMYEDVDLGDALGKISKQGKLFILTALQRDAKGDFVLDFLRAYTLGGMYLCDEGAIGENSREVISYLACLAELDGFDLGIFHPCLKGTWVKRNPDFVLGITQNPALYTQARLPLAYGTDTQAHKIWTNNLLSLADAVRIINHYIDFNSLNAPHQPNLTDLVTKIASLHRTFTKTHPNREEISPRQLIQVAAIVNDALKRGQDVERAVFMGVMVGYLAKLSGEDFSLQWEHVIKQFGEKYDMYLQEWHDQIKVTSSDGEIDFGGIRLSASSGRTNVSPQELLFPNYLGSQNAVLRAMALGVALNIPIAILQQDGADALDLVRRFALRSGRQLYTHFSDPQEGRMQLLASILPCFARELNDYGFDEQEISAPFKLCLGLLLSHMKTRQELDALTERPAEEILFFELMDAIPERQRVALNEILNKKEFKIVNEQGQTQTYYLPKWVQIVVSSSVEHKYSSAFINRFLPIRLNAVSDNRELEVVLSGMFPLIRNQEVRWLNLVAGAMQEWCKKNGFEINYSFSQRHIFDLARTLQLEKQRAITTGKFVADNPLYYVLCALYWNYYWALSDKDKQVFVDKILVEGLLGTFIAPGVSRDWLRQAWQDVVSSIEAEAEGQGPKTKEKKFFVQLSEISSGGYRLANGIRLWRLPNGALRIQTPAPNTYDVTKEELLQGKDITAETGGKGLHVRQAGEGGEITLTLSLVDSFCGVAVPRSEFNEERALPEDENPVFVRYTNRERLAISWLLRIWQRLKDGNNRISQPRVALMNGLTGTNKTTRIRNLSRMWGVPIYVLNSYADLRTSDLFAGLSVKN